MSKPVDMALYLSLEQNGKMKAGFTIQLFHLCKMSK